MKKRLRCSLNDNDEPTSVVGSEVREAGQQTCLSISELTLDRPSGQPVDDILEAASKALKENRDELDFDFGSDEDDEDEDGSGGEDDEDEEDEDV